MTALLIIEVDTQSLDYTSKDGARIDLKPNYTCFIAW